MAPIAPRAVGRMDDWMGRVRVSCMMVSLASGLVVSRIAWLRWLLTQGMRGCGRPFLHPRAAFRRITYVRPGTPPTDDVARSVLRSPPRQRFPPRENPIRECSMTTARDRPPEEAAEDTSFARGLRLLLTVADRGEVRADELSSLLEMPLSTVYRYLRTLGEFGFVDRHGGQFRPRPEAAHRDRRQRQQRATDPPCRRRPADARPRDRRDRDRRPPDRAVERVPPPGRDATRRCG